MIILKKGCLPAEEKYKGTCTNCKTEFVFKRSEASHYSGDQREGPYFGVRCPLTGCGNTVYVSEKTGRVNNANSSLSYNQVC